jgi:hypothetical protein
MKFFPIISLIALLVMPKISISQSNLNVTDYPFNIVNIECNFNNNSLVASTSSEDLIPTQFFKTDSYYTYCDICNSSNIYGIDFSKETLLLIIEAEGHNKTNISANGVFVLKDEKNKKIVCVVKKYYCNRWDYYGWDAVGIAIPKIPRGYKIEFMVDYIDGKSIEELYKEGEYEK